MRKNLILAAVPVAVVGVALAVVASKHSAKPADKFAEDLKQAQAVGLDLAQAQGASKYALTETNPIDKLTPGPAIKKGNGPKAVHSNTPTVKAAPTEVMATVVEDLPQVQVTQVSASPSPVEMPVPIVARPVPIATSPYPESTDGSVLRGGNGRGTGNSGNGNGGMGNGGGGWGGVVIRGGGVDGDNCDPRPSSRPGPVFTPGVGVMTTGGGTRPGMPGGSGVVISRPRRP